MDKQTLLEKLECLNTSTPETALLLSNLFVPVTFRKGTLFNWHEQTAHLLYFIETGLVRGYVFYEGEAYTCWILENGFLLPLNQAILTIEMEYTEFIAETRGWILNLDKAELALQKQPLLYRMLFEVLQEDLQAGKMRELILRLNTAEERFLFMEKRHADLVYKIPHPVLASLLNVKSKYLYKLKKRYRESKWAKKG